MRKLMIDTATLLTLVLGASLVSAIPGLEDHGILIGSALSLFYGQQLRSLLDSKLPK